MSDGAISQDEIDALLSGVSLDGLNSSGHVAGGSAVHIDNGAMQKFADNLKSLLAEKINAMTGASFSAGSPIVETLERDGFLAKIPEVVVASKADYSVGLTGEHSYILAPEFAQKLVNLISKEENADFDDMALSCISDVVSMHTASEVDELQNNGKISGVSCNPAETVSNPKAMIRVPQNKFTLITYPLTLDDNEYSFFELIDGQVAEKISNAYGGGAPAPQNAAASAPGMAQGGVQMGQNPMGGMPQGQPQMGMGGMQQMPQMNQMGMPQMPMGGMGQMQMPMGQMGMPMMGMGQNMGNIPNVQALQYQNLQGMNMGSEQGNISLIMDVFMEMTVELGRTKKQIKDILGMGEGTIIELDKLAGEPVDILVNHKPIAKGEVVVIDENFGVRVTEILSPLERVSDLR